jgi:protoporphyrin/coproporphyrin ferrochelatase
MTHQPSDAPVTGRETAGDRAGYEAILVVGFGGPERPQDIMPFLENVTRGRHVPRERLLEVAGHYEHLGGASPINSQVRELISALRADLNRSGIDLPIFWGNRNWHPMLGATLADMAQRGISSAIAIVLAAYGSYSSCRQYREDIARAQEAVGPLAPRVDKVRLFYNHPDFIAANAERVQEALDRFQPDQPPAARLVFTAHSIPLAMAQNCGYEQQLRETSRLIADRLGFPSEHYDVVYQSRSGRPDDPWLGPDVLDHIRTLKERGVADLVIHPSGFLSDHMEVAYDLDVEARHLCEELGMNLVRGHTVGVHPSFVRMLTELVIERIEGRARENCRAVGEYGPGSDTCPADCCRPGR